MLWPGDLRVCGFHPFPIRAAGMFVRWFAFRGTRHKHLRQKHCSLRWHILLARCWRTEVVVCLRLGRAWLCTPNGLSQHCHGCCGMVLLSVLFLHEISSSDLVSIIAYSLGYDCYTSFAISNVFQRCMQ